MAEKINLLLQQTLGNISVMIKQGEMPVLLVQLEDEGTRAVPIIINMFRSECPMVQVIINSNVQKEELKETIAELLRDLSLEGENFEITEKESIPILNIVRKVSQE